MGALGVEGSTAALTRTQRQSLIHGLRHGNMIQRKIAGYGQCRPPKDVQTEETLRGGWKEGLPFRVEAFRPQQDSAIGPSINTLTCF